MRYSIKKIRADAKRNSSAKKRPAVLKSVGKHENGGISLTLGLDGVGDEGGLMTVELDPSDYENPLLVELAASLSEATRLLPTSAPVKQYRVDIGTAYGKPGRVITVEAKDLTEALAEGRKFCEEEALDSDSDLVANSPDYQPLMVLQVKLDRDIIWDYVNGALGTKPTAPVQAIEVGTEVVA